MDGAERVGCAGPSGREFIDLMSPMSRKDTAVGYEALRGRPRVEPPRTQILVVVANISNESLEDRAVEKGSM